MNVINLLAKATGVEKKVKWSQSKKISVIGPDIFGYYDIFVDRNFNVAFFLPKDDGTLHVLKGNIVRGEQYLKFESNGEISVDKELPPKGFEWKINPENILLRGEALPPEQDIYQGAVEKSEIFEGMITIDWIKEHANELLTK